LGNFVFGGNWDPKDKRSALLNLTFSKTALTQRTVTPVLSDAYPERPVQPYFPDDGGSVLDHLNELSSFER
jgi:poly-gamma-glutamate synthesis protein (capsule biosynthesis protein)